MCGRLVVWCMMFLVTNAVAEEFSPGLRVGQAVPNFVAQDQQGKERNLANLMGENGILFVFNRSADWCPYCQSQLLKLERKRQEFSALGVTLVSITHDNQATLSRFAKARRINFPLLEDMTMTLVNAFGVRNEEYPPDHSAYGVPHPGMFYVDNSGIVRAKFFNKGYVNAPQLAQIIDQLKKQ